MCVVHNIFDHPENIAIGYHGILGSTPLTDLLIMNQI